MHGKGKLSDRSVGGDEVCAQWHASCSYVAGCDVSGQQHRLHSLNFYWFSRMIETVRKRFEPKPDDKLKQEKQERERRQSIIEELADGLDENELSGPKTPSVEKSEAMSTGVDGAAQRRAVKQES